MQDLRGSGASDAAEAAAALPPWTGSGSRELVGRPRARFTVGSCSDDAAASSPPAAAASDGSDLHSRVCALSRVLAVLRVELLNMKAQDEELSQQFFGIGRAIQQLRQQPSSPSCDSTASFSDAGSVFGSDVDLAAAAAWQLHDSCEVEFRARTSSLLLAPACRRASAGMVAARRKMCVSFDECGESDAAAGSAAGRLLPAAAR